LIISWSKNMKTVLLVGMGPTTLSALEALAAQFRVVGVIRDVGGNADGPDEVLQRARSLGVPVLPDASLGGVERAVVESNPDCTVVSSYDRILGAQLLKRGLFVNVHYAPLPQYRGRANVNWAIINDEPGSAITIHTIAPGLDAGNILFQERVPIEETDTVGDLYAKLNQIQLEVLADVVTRHLDGYTGEPQDDSAATYGCARVPDDGEINWSESTNRIFAMVRALSPPYPGAHTYLETRRVSIIRAAPLQDAPVYVGRVPGRVVGRSDKNGHVDVLTGDGILRIHEVATADSVLRRASDVITSTRQTLGLRVADLLARIEELSARLNRLEGAGDDDGSAGATAD
jgi:methionyl-tRNA formyltransferase